MHITKMRDQFRHATKSLDESYNAAINVIMSAPAEWSESPEHWTKQTIDDAKETATHAISLYLPLLKRYKLMDLFNKFMADRFAEKYKRITVEKISERSEVEIELLKLMQGGTNPEINQRKRDELAELLHMGKDSIDDYIVRLRIPERQLLGSQVYIPSNELIPRKNVYGSTIHPVFLALNLTEVNFLINVVREHFADSDDYKDVSEQLAFDVYRQLSEYAQKRMNARNERETENFFDGRGKERFVCGYRHEDMYQAHKSLYCDKYFRCILEEKATKKKHTGYLVAYEDHIYRFTGDDGVHFDLNDDTFFNYVLSIDSEHNRG